MAINVANDVPTVGFKPCGRVIGEPALDFSID
jgi:hypothetical protein